MGRGLDKDTPGGAVSRKNNKNLYTLSDAEINSMKIINDAFTNDKKVFQTFTKEKKPGRIRRAFSAFWREIARQKKLPYKEIDVKDFAKDWEIYAKEPGIFNISDIDGTRRDNNLLQGLKKHLEEEKTNKDFHVVFLEYIEDTKDVEEKKILQEWGEKAVQFDWTKNFGDDNPFFKEKYKKEKQKTRTDYSWGDSEKDFFGNVKDSLDSGKQAFLQTAEDEKQAREKTLLWREVAAQKKLPFFEISEDKAKDWLSPDGPWRGELKTPGVYNIEISDDFENDSLVALMQEIYSGEKDKKDDAYKDIIINIIDRRKEKNRKRMAQSAWERLQLLD